MKKLLFSIFKQYPGEIQSLNGIRAIGSVAVIFFHYWAVTSTLLNKDLGIFNRILENLESFMDMFFILSAFLIGGGLNYLWKKNGELNIKNYFFKRIIRIFPAFYVFLFINVIIGYYFLKNTNIESLSMEMKTYFQGFADVHSYWIYDALYISNYSKHRLVPQGWSLSLEEQFYLFLPIVLYFLLFKQSSKIRIILLAILYFIPLTIRIYNVPSILNQGDYLGKNFFPTHTHADSLVMGLIIMELFFNYPEKFKRLLSGVVKYILAIFAFVLLIYSHLIPFAENSYLYSAFRINFFNISLGLVFMFGLKKSLLSRILAAKIFTPFSRVSYSMYLYHLLVLGEVGKYYFGSTRNINTIEFVIGFIMALLFSFIVAWIGYILVEAPFMHLKKYTEKKNQILLLKESMAQETTLSRDRYANGQEINYVASSDLRYLSAMLDFYTFVPGLFFYLFAKAIPENGKLFLVFSVIFILLTIVLQMFYIVKHRSSVGKYFYHLQVVHKDGTDISIKDYILFRAILGNILYLYPPIGIMIDSIFMSFKGKLSLKDRLSNSRVIDLTVTNP